MRIRGRKITDHKGQAQNEGGRCILVLQQWLPLRFWGGAGRGCPAGEKALVVLSQVEGRAQRGYPEVPQVETDPRSA